MHDGTIVAMRRNVLASLAVAALALALAVASSAAAAVESCELNGEHVNPNNGNTTQGKTGLMRCRDGEGGPVVREQELKAGAFMGVVRRFEDGVLSKEYRVDERGNRDGLAREWVRGEGGGKPVLVREETYRDGSAVGLVRSWYPTGKLRRVSFQGDDSRELAAAEFNAQGQLYELRCGPRAVLGSDADDAHWCGHVGGASTVVLYNGKGAAKARVSYERGERRKYEVLAESGEVREVQETTATGGVEQSFYGNGNKRREQQWVALPGERNRRYTSLDQEFHESGKLVRERRWKMGERVVELVSEQTWYLNGQPKERTEIVAKDGRSQRVEASFHDNGTKASEGSWRVAATNGRGSDTAIGVHRSWDADGRLRSESHYDERGRITRERSFDAAGVLVRDDEVFEDGSRKAFGK